MADKATRPTPGSALSARHHHLSLRDEVDRLFDSFFPPAFGRSLLDLDPGSGRAFRSLGDVGTPGIDVKECADHYEIAAELPGVDKQDVAVTVIDGVLSIAGETHTERKQGAMTERAFDTFKRLFRLPKDADAGAIGAAFDKGVLTVTVPRHEDAGQPDQTIEIKGH